MIVGMAAHVDSGKTTLSEQILYRCGVLKSPGRVDHKDAFLDDQDIERERGITIFAGIGQAVWKEVPFTLLDTPGHVDFSGEAERAIKVLDLAVLLVDAAEGLKGHTISLWHLLRHNHVPTLIFLNRRTAPKPMRGRC